MALCINKQKDKRTFVCSAVAYLTDLSEAQTPSVGPTVNNKLYMMRKGARGGSVGATSRKVADSIPDGVIDIIIPALGLTQPLT
jgi:hypothetical protein